MLDGGIVEFFQLIVVENQLIAPCPAVVAVVLVDFVETAEHLLNVVDVAFHNVVGQPLLFALRQQQSGKVQPASHAYGGLGLAEETFLHGTLQHGTHIDAQGYIVVFQSLAKRRGIDNVFVEIIGRDIVAAGLTEILENLAPLEDFTHCERRKPVEVDDGLLRLLAALVALGPFLDIAVETHGSDVSAGNQIAVVAVCHQIRERQVAGVGMVHQFAEAYREGTDGGGHQHIGTAGGFSAALKCSVVERSHLVGMVREIGV